jgi:hypothetical protein
LILELRISSLLKMTARGVDAHGSIKNFAVQSTVVDGSIY